MAEVVRTLNERKAIGKSILQIHNARMVMAMMGEAPGGAALRALGVDALYAELGEVGSPAAEVVRRAASRLPANLT